MCASFRRSANTIPARKGFVVTFTIEEGAQYHVGTVEVMSNVRAIDPAIAAQSAQTRARATSTTPTLVEKSVEAMTIEAAQARLCLCHCAAARRPQFRDQDHQPRLRRRGRRARLYRAHQHPRQYAHARLCDPPRIRYWRRRRLQPRADRPRRAAAEESRLSSRRSRSPTSRARRPIASSSMSMSRNSRPANSRFLAAIRPPTASLAKSASPSATCMGRGHYAKASVHLRATCSRRRASFVEPYLLGYRMAAGVDLFCAAKFGEQLRFLRLPVDRHQSAPWLCADRRIAFQPRYSFYQQKITLPTNLNDCQFSSNATPSNGRPRRESDNEAGLAPG